MSAGDITHAFTHLLGLGGVSSMLRRHLSQGRADGRQRAVIHFEREPFTSVAGPRQVVGLGLSWFNNGFDLRRRWRAAFPSGVGGNLVYHNAWGLVSTADLDAAGRRIVLLHSHWHGVEDVVNATAGLVDGWICVSKTLSQLVKAHLPGFPDERIAVLPVPAGTPPTPLPPHRPLDGRPLVLGYSGRIVRAQKRVERLPELDRLLTAAGVDCRWEILGDGPELGPLRSAMPSDRSRFHGRVAGAAYWEALGGCDLLVFASDYEGMPISLVEAFRCGVLPLFPRIACGADDYVTRIAPEMLYEPGDLTDAVRGVQWLRRCAAGEIGRLRDQARFVAAPHADGTYDRDFARFIEHISVAPRVSATGAAARRRPLGEWVPYAVLNRLPHKSRWRRGYV